MSVDQPSPVPTGDMITIGLTDTHYPPLLREIHDPPPRLYLRGNPAVLLQPQLAIVGARRASAAGLRLARDIAAALAEAGIVVCSGLALGIDGAAHRGAIEAGGETTAVLGTGVDTIYPRRHRALGEAIASGGCLVSEFPPDTAPLPHNFPRRNRLISGMSLGTLVVEAALPSGSLITASTAMEQGRDVFALPWSPLHEGGAGCLKLLREGAVMVTRVQDILDELGAMGGCQHELLRAVAGQAVDSDAAKVLGRIGFEVVGVDDLAVSCGCSTGELLPLLSRLEMAGAIQRAPGGYIRV
jgi:DNA processing protein